MVASELLPARIFHDAIAAQGMTLDMARLDEHRTTHTAEAYNWEFGSLEHVFQMLCHALRKDPEDRLLANGSTPGSELDLARLPSDGLSQAVGAIIRASGLPISERPTAQGRSFSGGDEVLNTCLDAEPLFLQALDGATRYLQTRGVQSNEITATARFVSDGHGRAVFMQKFWQPSALVLGGEVYVDGIPYPEGTIVKLNISNQYGRFVKLGVNVVPLSAVVSVMPQRISAFARPYQRRLDFVHRKYQNIDTRKLAVCDMAAISRVGDDVASFVQKKRRWFKFF